MLLVKNRYNSMQEDLLFVDKQLRNRQTLISLAVVLLNNMAFCAVETPSAVSGSILYADRSCETASIP